MKLLSSFLIAAYANTVVDESNTDTVVDERECHAIDNHVEKYRKFAAKSADVAGTHTALELTAATAGDNEDDVPNCLADCDNDDQCLFVIQTSATGECDMAKIKHDESETIFNRPSMWTETDDLVDDAATDIYIKCQAGSPCAVEYYQHHKWTEFHGKPSGVTRTIEGTPLADDATHDDGTPATKADCPRVCAEMEDCDAFYHNTKTDECEIYTNALELSWAVKNVGTEFTFDEVDGGYTMAKCIGRCLDNWGKDANGCFPELVNIECQADGLKLNAQLSDIYENHMLLTDAQKVSDVKIQSSNLDDVVGGTFDENGEIEIIKTWEELGVTPIYHADDDKPLIEFSTTIKPLNPNIALTENGPEIFLARTDNFYVTCLYPAEFDINTEYTSLTEEIGITGTETIDDMPMIGEFHLQTFHDDVHTTEITPDDPINLGEMIYNKMTVTNLPTGLDYIVTHCEVNNVANPDWEADDETLVLFEEQTCKNNDMKDVLGINIHGKDPQSLEYSFDFVSFSFQSNQAETNSQDLRCHINICGTIGNDVIDCTVPPAQDTDCPTGFTL